MTFYSDVTIYVSDGDLLIRRVRQMIDHGPFSLAVLDFAPEIGISKV